MSMSPDLEGLAAADASSAREASASQARGLALAAIQEHVHSNEEKRKATNKVLSARGKGGSLRCVCVLVAVR